MFVEYRQHNRTPLSGARREVVPKASWMPASSPPPAHSSSALATDKMRSHRWCKSGWYCLSLVASHDADDREFYWHYSCRSLIISEPHGSADIFDSTLFHRIVTMAPLHWANMSISPAASHQTLFRRAYHRIDVYYRYYIAYARPQIWPPLFDNKYFLVYAHAPITDG